MKGRRLTLIGWYLLTVLLIGVTLFLLCSCKSTSTIESNTEIQKVSQLTERMDSLLRTTASWQQDIYTKQSSLVDSIRQMERNDSNHVVIVNETGDTVREVIRIERVIERERSTESQESETVVHLQSQVDSLVRLTTESKAMTDSLLREHSKEVVVEKKPSFGEKMKWLGGGVALALIGVFAVVSAFMRKS